jgi:Ser/Thr protein kinase RdoA (MazF antagonist)
MGRKRDEHRQVLDAVWKGYDDPRRITRVADVSANVSTNHVYRLSLDDGSHVIAKVSSYGSYFLFAEDHDRLHLCAQLLKGTRFGSVLADVLAKDGRAYTWYDGSMWAALYEEVPRKDWLPRVLTAQQVENFGREIAALHRQCADIAGEIPLTSKSIRSDAIHLLDLLSSPYAPSSFQLDPDDIAVLRRHTHEFLIGLEAVRYDYWQKIPVLIDWNLGNFSIDLRADGSFQLFSRWDYDWFRIEPRLLDFYFLSRVSSRTGDRTVFSYSSHTLLEPSFLRFMRAYHEVYPLSESDLRFLPEVYRFFILNYVILEGARFFRPDYWTRFRRDAARLYLPELERFDVSPLLRVLDGPVST